MSTQDQSEKAAPSLTPRAFPTPRHDHRRCLREALSQAEAHCEAQGARLTPLRRKVLELVWESHAPVGAYDILRRLSESQGPAAPPTVYRALDFLQDHGLVHRIESLNAFIGCPAPAHDHAQGPAGQFLICENCGVAVELENPRIAEAIAAGAGALDFEVSGATIEIRGRCPACRQAEGGKTGGGRKREKA